MSERLTSRYGYAVMARFVYSDPDKRDHVQKTDMYHMGPGEGFIFWGKGDTPEDPIPFTRKTIEEELENILTARKENVQLIAFIDESSGELLMTGGAGGSGVRINNATPKEERVITAQYGRLLFAGIWGESQEEADAHLRCTAGAANPQKLTSQSHV